MNVLLIGVAAQFSVAANITSDFRELVNPLLITYSSGAAPTENKTQLGPVTITNGPVSLIYYLDWVTGTPMDPSGPGGWGATTNVPMILNISPAVSAFGITFGNHGNTAGSILKVFDGLNGTGELIAQVQSVPVQQPWTSTRQPIDFVGVIDEHRKIRSAVLMRQGNDDIRISAMAISIPEPATFALLFQATIWLIVHRRRWLQ